MAIGISRVGQLLNPGNYLNGACCVSIDSSGEYAYVVSKDEDALVIINISTKSSPSRVGQITGAGNYLNFVRGVHYVQDGNYVYAVSKDSDAFVIIDVSNKTSPTRVGQLVGAGEYLSEPVAVKVIGDYAYVVSGLSDALVIIDISTKSAPVRTGQITGSGNWLDSPGGLDISSDGNWAFVTSSIQNSLAIFDVSNKTNPLYSGKISTASGSYLDGARGVIAKNTYAYIAAYDFDCFTIINITNKTSPSYVSHITGSGNYLNGAFSLTVDKDEKYAFVASLDQDAISVIDIGTKNNPINVAHINGAGEYLDGVQDVSYLDWYAYAASSVSDAFVVLQFTPAAPDAPTGVACVEGEEKNDISWNSMPITDTYNLYWMKYEFFKDEFTSLDLWNQYKDVGTETIEINSDKLRFSNSVGTGCRVVNKNNIPSGDFDIFVDLTTYTPDDNSNGHKAILRTLDSYPFSSIDGAEVYYYVTNSGTTHNIVSNIWIYSTPYNNSTTIAGKPTKLRITRVGNIVTTYYYISSWIQVDTKDFSTRSGNILLVTLDTLQTSGNGGLTEFDNFDFYVDLKSRGTKIAIVTSPYEHTGLDGDDNYIYVVTGENPGGESDQSEIVSGVPTKAPVAIPTISGIPGDSENYILIPPVDSYPSYNVYWSLTPGVTKETGIKIENVTRIDYWFTHQNLTKQNYYYVATSFDGVDESDISNEICLKPDFEGKIYDHNTQIELSLLYQYQNKD